MKSAFIAYLLLLQAVPSFGTNDNKLQEIEYQTNRVMQIEGTLGYQVTVLLSPDEQIKSIAVGDSSAWQVTANKGGNNIFIKLSGPEVKTNMTVVTNVRLYSFELVPSSNSYSNIPYILKFTYPSDGASDETVNPREIKGRYKITGAKALWPSGIVDDGSRTFIEWPKTSDIPAVYALDQAGREILVNGMMRQDRLVIESIATKLIFRIDKKVAQATRRQVEGQP